MEQKKRIQILFKEQTQVGEYNDALYFTEEEFNNTKQEDIDAEIQKRVSNWVMTIQNPPAPIEPTKEQLLAEEAAILEQKAQIEARVLEITAKVAEIDAKPKPIDIQPIAEEVIP